MKKLLVAVAILGVWASVLIPVVSALEPPPEEFQPPLPTPYRTWCSGISSFESGCVSSEGPWSSAYSQFADDNGLAKGAGGARVKWFPSKSRSLDQVLYIVGPYLASPNSNYDYDTIEAEREAVQQLAPAMQAVDLSMKLKGVSIVYIGFGRFEHGQQPVAQRVVATKEAIKAFETERARKLGRTPESTALIGLSLGGVVAKIALTELENVGFDHGVETYISFDSPHWGAYTSPSLQRVPMFLEAVFRWVESEFSWSEGLYDNPLDDYRDAAGRVTQLTLKNPVAQDMLAVNIAYDGWKSPNIDYIRDRYRQLPSESRNVAIASGSVTGQSPGLGDAYFSVATGKSGSKLKQMLNMTTFIPSAEADNSFWGQASFKAPITSSLQMGKRVYYPKNPNHYPYTELLINDYERAPCAHSNEIVDVMVDQLNHQVAGSFWGGFSMEATETRACFIPTFSAIIGDSNGNGPVPGTSKFDRVIGNSLNKPHLATTDDMNRAILAELNTVFDGAESVADAVAGAAEAYVLHHPDTQTEFLDLLEEVAASSCDFNSGSHSLEQAHAMFPNECDRPWNPETDKCDYGANGWRCYEVRNDKPIKFGNLTRPLTSDPSLGAADAEVDVVEQLFETNAGCDFSSGTHNLEDTRAMFPDNCGRDWNPVLDKCDYSDEGWRCFQNN